MKYVLSLMAALAVLVAFHYHPLREMLWTDAAIISARHRFLVAIGFESMCMIVCASLFYLIASTFHSEHFG